MDMFGWEINRPTSEMGLSPCSWRNQQRETCSRKSSAQSIIIDHGIGGGDVDLAEALLISSKRLHGVVVNTNELTKVDAPLPPSHLEGDAVSGSSAAAEASQSQEALLLAAAAELAMSEAATAPWVVDAFASLGHLREHFGLPSDPPHVHIDIADEEDVSAILSNCDNIPNYLLSCSGNVSSGESAENCSSLRNGGDKPRCHHQCCSNVDEVVSRGPLNPDATARLMASKSKVDQKRKDRDECAGGEGSLYRNHVLQSESSATTGPGGTGFRIFFENAQSKYWKKPRPEDKCHQRAASSSTSIEFRLDNGYEPDAEALAQVKEMIYRAAAMRPVSLGAVEASLEKPKRKNVRISCDPQTVAARQRRERISERLRVLQRLVPGGSKMDTASMLDEAANYLKFLKSQVSALETLGAQGTGSMAAACSSSPSDLPLSSSVPFGQAFPMQTLHPQTQTQLVQAHHQRGTSTPARSAASHPLQFCRSAAPHPLQF